MAPRPPAGSRKLAPLCFFDNTSTETTKRFARDVEERSHSMFSENVDGSGHIMASPESGSDMVFRSLALIGTVLSIKDAKYTHKCTFIDGWLPSGKYPAICGDNVYLGDYIRFQLATNAALGLCAKEDLPKHFPKMFQVDITQIIRLHGTGAGTAVLWPGWNLEMNRAAWGYLVLLGDFVATGGLGRQKFNLRQAHLSTVPARQAFRAAPWAVLLQYNNVDVEPNFPDYEKLAADQDKAAARRYKNQLCEMDILMKVGEKHTTINTLSIKISEHFSPMTFVWKEQYAKHHND